VILAAAWVACGLVGLALDYEWNRAEWMFAETVGVTVMAMGLCILLGPIGLVLAIIVHRKERAR
jgi:hypothetical protein